MTTINTVIFDMDGTILQQTASNQDVWSKFFRAADLDNECQEIVKKHHNYETNTTTVENHILLVDKCCKLLAGRDAAPILSTFSPFSYTSGFIEFCGFLRSYDIKLGLATLSIKSIAEIIQAEANLDLVRANDIHIRDGKFTGTGTIYVPMEGKGKAVEEMFTLLGGTRETTAFFGDSGNDKEAWKAVDHPFGINAKTDYHPLLNANFTDFHQAKEYFHQHYFK